MQTYLVWLLLLAGSQVAYGQASTTLTTLAAKNTAWLDSVQQLSLPQQVAAVRARAWRDTLLAPWGPVLCRGLLSAAAPRPVAPTVPSALTKPAGFPLVYVLNGQPYFNNDAATVSQLQRALAANRVRQVTLLRDVRATAIYGSRAANGVIILSSKKE